MKVKIKRRYRDRDTLVIMKAGEYADYEPERALALASWGYVTLVEEAQKKEDASPSETVVVETVISGDDLAEIMKDANKPADAEEETEKEEIAESQTEKKEINPFPEKSDQPGKKKPGRKPKQ